MLPTTFDSKDIPLATIQQFLKLGGVVRANDHILYYEKGNFFFDSGGDAEIASGIWDYFENHSYTLRYTITKHPITKHYNKGLL